MEEIIGTFPKGDIPLALNFMKGAVDGLLLAWGDAWDDRLKKELLEEGDRYKESFEKTGNLKEIESNIESILMKCRSIFCLDDKEEREKLQESFKELLKPAIEMVRHQKNQMQDLEKYIRHQGPNICPKVVQNPEEYIDFICKYSETRLGLDCLGSKLGKYLFQGHRSCPQDDEKSRKDMIQGHKQRLTGEYQNIRWIIVKEPQD